MRILCTNDDGIHAPGLKIVEEIARALSDDVWVVAPELDQSGVSHSLSLNDPLRLREVGPRHFAVRGTPTDCVIMGARHILGETMPDLVLSGVNKGRNVAEDVVYSGTIAGALEGTILGMPSFALSQEFSMETRNAPLWETSLKFGPQILRKVIDAGVPKNTVINVNFPACAPRGCCGRPRYAAGQAQSRIPQGRPAPRRPRQSLFLDRVRAARASRRARGRHRSRGARRALCFGDAAPARSDRRGIFGSADRDAEIAIRTGQSRLIRRPGFAAQCRSSSPGFRSETASAMRGGHGILPGGRRSRSRLQI